MRSLYKKQKKMLLAEFNRLVTEEQIEYPISDDIPAKTYNKIFDIHPFETFDSHVDRLFSDLSFEKSHSRSGNLIKGSRLE